MSKACKLSVHFDRRTILAGIGCHETDSKFLEYVALLDEVFKAHEQILAPEGYMDLNEVDGRLECQCLVTLGPRVDSAIASYFKEYAYLEGMLLNGLADHILFEATNAFYDEVCRVAKAKNLYPSVRKEPGLSDVPIEDQKRLYDSLVVPLGLDFELTEGYMLSPTKSLLYYYTLSEAPCELGLDHDCGGCAQPCNMQTHTIKVTVGDKMTLVKGRHGERLLDVLRKNGILISASCGGARLCGKCRVQIKGRRLPLMEDEKHFLSGKEIEEGVVLACFHTVDQAMEVHVPSCHDDNNLISEELSAFEVRLSRYTRSKDHYEINRYGIAVDIGTTTLAIGVVSLLTGEVMAVKKCLNPQGPYGADIISRIQYTIDNPDHQLGILIRGAIRTLMDKAIAEMALTVADVKHMVVSGNTTMIYLLLGLNPAPLAAAPFETLNLGIHTTRGESLFGSCYAFPVTTLPWVSAYVGGDIVSGLYANDLIHKQGHWLYLDIGTNGEMVLKSGRRLICAATAAGPAFEGANIRCGIGPVAGAICEVIPKQGHHEIVTLGKEEAIGLCGSGLLDIVAILRNEGRIESGGYMKETYALTDTIALYPEDVRQVQLAKGAIRAGADVLLKASGITADELNGILLAGGFGSHIHVGNAERIGLIPAGVSERVMVVGNASLAGAVRFLIDEQGREEIRQILERCDYVELSNNADFATGYVERMIFE